MIMRMVVVLPAPLGPRKPTTSPRCDREAQLVYGGHMAVAFADTFDRYHLRLLKKRKSRVGFRSTWLMREGPVLTHSAGRAGTRSRHHHFVSTKSSAARFYTGHGACCPPPWMCSHGPGAVAPGSARAQVTTGRRCRGIEPPSLGPAPSSSCLKNTNAWPTSRARQSVPGQHRERSVSPS